MEKKKSFPSILGNIIGTVIATCLAICFCGAIIALTVRFLTYIF